jgi:hypothetical protein
LLRHPDKRETAKRRVVKNKKAFFISMVEGHKSII